MPPNGWRAPSQTAPYLHFDNVRNGGRTLLRRGWSYSYAAHFRKFPKPILVDVYVSRLLLNTNRSRIEQRVAQGFIIVPRVISDAVGPNLKIMESFRPLLRNSVW
jgi:hypothetical protein